MRIPIDPVRRKPRNVKRVADILKADGIIVYPTDTVYGMGCSISNRKGINRIHAIKHSKKPMSIMLPDLKGISAYAKVNNEAYRVLKDLLPGPYTFILPATRLVPRLLQSNRKSIGIRIPDHWFCQDLVMELGEPIITTSVPETDKGLHVDPLQIASDLGHLVDAVVDSGILPDTPSTIISMEEATIQILRRGLGPVDSIQANIS